MKFQRKGLLIDYVRDEFAALCVAKLAMTDFVALISWVRNDLFGDL